SLPSLLRRWLVRLQVRHKRLWILKQERWFRLSGLCSSGGFYLWCITLPLMVSPGAFSCLTLPPVGAFCLLERRQYLSRWQHLFAVGLNTYHSVLTNRACYASLSTGSEF